jgi:hypothetical protein
MVVFFVGYCSTDGGQYDNTQMMDGPPVPVLYRTSGELCCLMFALAAFRNPPTTWATRRGKLGKLPCGERKLLSDR